MERITRFRAYLLLLVFVLILGIFAFRLYDMQIIETGGNTNNALILSMILLQELLRLQSQTLMITQYLFQTVR